MNHEYQDNVSLELARRVAEELPRRAEWIALARANLARWKQLNADAPRLVQCYDEWERLLERPAAEIAAILVQRTDEGQRLRQNSPFAGALTPQAVWAIKERCRRAASAA